MTMPSISRRGFATAAGAALIATPSARAAATDPIRKIRLLSETQSADPEEFQSAELVAQMWRALGLDVEVDAMPALQRSSLVWNQRSKWDCTLWRMVARPERSDPDELIYSLFNSATANGGYDFVDYVNPAYDRVSQAQREAIDRTKRQKLVREAQAIINHDQPYVFLVYPKKVFAYLNTAWKPSSMIDQDGIGIRNFWTYLNVEPVGPTRDMVVNASVSLNSLNPLYIGGEAASWVTELIWDRIIRVDPHGAPKPWAAESVTWVNPTTLDISLRPNQKWHDGRPVTVDDVVFSFTAPADGNMAPMYRPFVSNIASVTPTGSSTVRFVLKAPDAGFLTASLGKLNLIAKHVWEPRIAGLKQKGLNAQQEQPTTLIGSGPFRVERFDLQQEIVLAANTAHWSPPKLSRWIMRVIPNAAAALQMLPRGELNFLSDYTGDPNLLVAMAKQNAQVSVHATTSLGFRFVALNERRPPFNDRQFRRALSLAVNRELIAAAAFEGFAVPANSMISPVFPFWHDPGVDQIRQNVPLAKQILAKAGYRVIDGRLHYPPGTTETLGGT